MGGIFSSANNYTQTDIATALVQSYTGSCNETCTSNISNVTIDYQNSVIVGNLTFSTGCTANGTCTINNAFNAVSATALNLIATANASTSPQSILGLIFGTDLGLKFDVSNTRTLTDISESISQTVSQQCNFSQSASISNINLYYNNSSLTGNVAYDATNTQGANCILNNISNAQAAIQADIRTEANAGGAIKWWELVIAVVALIIIVGVVLAIVHETNKKDKSTASKTTSSTTTTPAGTAATSTTTATPAAA